MFAFNSSDGNTWEQSWNSSPILTGFCDIEVGDLDGDNEYDDVVLANSYNVTAFNESGGILWASNVAAYTRSLLVSNMDSDSTDEVVVGYQSNVRFYNASILAARSIEAVQIVLDAMRYNYKFIDSKEWQKELLPNIKGSDNLKKASLELGCKLFPNSIRYIERQKDADGILIAEYARRKFSRGEIK